jgi:hypothetical protein
MRVKISPISFAGETATHFVCDDHRVVLGNVVSRLSFVTDAGRKLDQRQASLTSEQYLEWCDTDAQSDDDHFFTLAHAARLGLTIEGTPAPTEPAPYRVSKDTIVSRVAEMGALPAVMAALTQQSAEDQFMFQQSAWFWSTNQSLRGLAGALGLDADAVLAPDPFI